MKCSGRLKLKLSEIAGKIRIKPKYPGVGANRELAPLRVLKEAFST